MNEHPMNKFLRNFGPKIGVKIFNSSDIDYILEHNITNKRMHIELKYNNSPYNELTDLQYKIYLQQHKLNKNDPNFISSYLFKRDPFLKKTDIIEIGENKNTDKIITLYYNRNDCGCRMSQWTEKEIECLNNNFSKFQSK